MNYKDMIYTDLAIEASEMIKEKENIETEGVRAYTSSNTDNDIKVTRINIDSDTGSEKIGKPKGDYITIESECLKIGDKEKHEEISKILAKELTNLLVAKDNEKHKEKNKNIKVLIVGLGNKNVSADCLGPKVSEEILVTRHLFKNMNKELDKEIFGEVSAITPGVMGMTGIETMEIVQAITEKIKPDLVIAIDSLAARKLSRINTTIQMTNTGIHPGSGVGNKRAELSFETLKVPVIAIGVPTVVNAITLANDITNEKLNIENIEEIRNLCVTPKEEDLIIKRIKTILSEGINLYLHKGLTRDEIRDYIY